MWSLPAFLVILFAWAAPAIASQAVPVQDEIRGPDASIYTLENGLTLAVIPDRRAPVVTHMIWYKVGSADDPLGKSGLAHFLEHLMFKGTANHTQGEFSSAVAEIGGQENAFTSYDYTAYYQKVSPPALAAMMAFEADRMRNVVLSDEVVDPERQVVLEERSSRIDTSPGSILNEFVRGTMFMHHPYGTPIIGWEHEIRDLTKEDALSFYNRWYQPWNATVVVAGDVEPAEVLELVKQTYGKIKATSTPVSRDRVKEPKPVVARELSYVDERVTQPVWRRSFLVPSYWNAEPGESEALELLATVLGDSVTSRIRKTLVLDDQVATSAGAYYSGSSMDMTEFSLYATPRGETDLAQLETAMETQIDRLLKAGIEKDELDRAKRTYLNTLIYSQDSQVALARIFGTIFTLDGDVEDFTSLPERLQKITVEDVNRVARKYLDRTRAVTSLLLPKTTDNEVTQ